MPRRRLLAHDAGAVPQGGSAVYRQLTCLSKSYWKEAAGHVHLLFALKQAGLYGEEGAGSASIPRDSAAGGSWVEESPRSLREHVPPPLAPSPCPDDPLVEEDEEEEAPRAAAADEGSEPSRPGSAADFDNLEDVAGAKWKGRGKKKKKKKEEGEEDLYALLGLQHERWMATPEVIKSAYRKAALLHHPDKQARRFFLHISFFHAGVGLATDEEEKQRIEERFKRIQASVGAWGGRAIGWALGWAIGRAFGWAFGWAFGQAFGWGGEGGRLGREGRWRGWVFGAQEAYETLSDPARRREFDSTDDFDDSLPTSCAPADFYKVNSFYDFWFSFRSWREFPHPDEEDIEQAESREHRRWIERFNAKLRERGKRDETRRLREFVDTAYRQDPRILRRKEEERAERERRKAAREAERAAAAEAARRAEEAAAAARAAEETAAAEARKQRQADKKLLQKERARLRRLVALALAASSGGGGGEGEEEVGEEEVEQLCSSLALPDMQALCEALAAGGGASARQRGALGAALASVRAAAAGEAAQREAAHAAALAAQEAAQRQEAAHRSAKLQAWDEEEVRMLRRALERFPPGTTKRWEQVQAYVRTRTVDEILDMVKHSLKSGKFAGAQQTDTFVIAKKRQGNLANTAQADTRAAAFSDVSVTLKGEAAALLDPAATAVANGAAASGGGGGGAVAQAAAPKTVASAGSGEWTEAQELALVKACKSVGKDAEDRWGAIAALVPGKTKQQCFKRFKELKEGFKSKKAAAT
eukprot:scaffold9.g3237.t1